MLFAGSVPDVEANAKVGRDLQLLPHERRWWRGPYKTTIKRTGVSTTPPATPAESQTATGRTADSAVEFLKLVVDEALDYARLADIALACTFSPLARHNEPQFCQPLLSGPACTHAVPRSVPTRTSLTDCGFRSAPPLPAPPKPPSLLVPPMIDADPMDAVLLERPDLPRFSMAAAVTAGTPPASSVVRPPRGSAVCGGGVGGCASGAFG